MAARSSMTDRKCRCCSNPVNSTDEICSQCVKRTRRHLANQAAYLADLETEMARQSVKQPPSEGGRSAEIPLPYSPVAGDLIGEQRNLLTSWVRLCVDEHIIAEWPADTIPSLASWLIVALPVLRRHGAAGEFAAEIRKLTDDITKCIDTAEFRTRMPAGPCPEQYTDEHGVKDFCPGEVEMLVPYDEREPARLYCTSCKVEYPRGPAWWRTGAAIKQREDALKAQQQLAATFTRRVA